MLVLGIFYVFVYFGEGGISYQKSIPAFDGPGYIFSTVGSNLPRSKSSS